MNQESLTAAFSAALIPLVEKIDGLTTAVGGLVSERATDRSRLPASPPTAAVSVTANGPEANLAPLHVTAPDTARWTLRHQEAVTLGLDELDSAEYRRFGGRGLYRYNRERCLELTRAGKVCIIEDALDEDTQEAADMGADLLKSWGLSDPPR